MSELSQQAQRKLNKLKLDYVQSLPEKIQLIEQSWENNDLDDLRMQTHKIAGSAASFGLPDLSFAARTLEALCKTRIDNNRGIVVSMKNDKTLVNAYHVFLKACRKNIEG